MAKDKDAIGFDPVRWVERLREVAETSQFNEDAKDLIESTLSDLSRALVRLGGK